MTRSMITTQVIAAQYTGDNSKATGEGENCNGRNPRTQEGRKEDRVLTLIVGHSSGCI